MKLNIANWCINCDGANGRGGADAELDIDSVGLYSIDDNIIGLPVCEVLSIVYY